MITISVANGKGGSGKTTMLTVLALSLADAGQNICVIDLDPAGNFSDWVEARREWDAEPPFHFISHNGNEEAMQKLLAETARGGEYDFLLIDTEGAARSMTLLAAQFSNLILIPIKDHPAEARKAITLINNLNQLVEDTGVPVNYVIAFTQTGGLIQSRDKKNIEAQLRHFELPILEAELLNRQSFVTLAQDGLTLRELEAGKEFLFGEPLDPNRPMSRSERQRRASQIKSAKTAIQTANNFTEAVVNHAISVN